MIGYLRGKLVVKKPNYVIVECNGVGYHVHISLYTYSKLEPLAEGVVHTHLQVREDDMSLWGFFDESERALFLHLISVSGIGANTARVVLSSSSPDDVGRAIANGDSMFFNKIKGIGPKTAQRIIIDLRDKVMKDGVAVGQDSPVLAASGNIVRNEALSALLALGFPKPAVEKTINSIIAKDPNIDSVEELIKQVLKQMR